jgi:hypothetical protein
MDHGIEKVAEFLLTTHDLLVIGKSKSASYVEGNAFILYGRC